MARNSRSLLYNRLKSDGWVPEKKFTSYTLTELEALTLLRGLERVEIPPLAEAWTPEPEPLPDYLVERSARAQERPADTIPAGPYSNTPNPAELPGQRLNMPPEIIRIDDQGRQWYQEEVTKPAYPKPRGRRVLKYMETGVKTETVKSGEYVETFEVAGEMQERPAEVKITLPSYQVGIYKDPRFPFKIHCYNGREGFDLFEVQEYYGGAELIPATVKRLYIENELCYDIRSVIQTIQAEYRQLTLQKGYVNAN